MPERKPANISEAKMLSDKTVYNEKEAIPFDTASLPFIQNAWFYLCLPCSLNSFRAE
jgi:hypothetical protein